jgi:hypothetical protein
MNPYIFEMARHTMRETEHRAAERRLVASLRPSRRVRFQRLLSSFSRRRPAVGARRPAVDLRRPAVSRTVRPTPST